MKPLTAIDVAHKSCLTKDNVFMIHKKQEINNKLQATMIEDIF